MLENQTFQTSILFLSPRFHPSLSFEFSLPFIPLLPVQFSYRPRLLRVRLGLRFCHQHSPTPSDFPPPLEPVVPSLSRIPSFFSPMEILSFVLGKAPEIPNTPLIRSRIRKLLLTLLLGFLIQIGSAFLFSLSLFSPLHGFMHAHPYISLGLCIVLSLALSVPVFIPAIPNTVRTGAFISYDVLLGLLTWPLIYLDSKPLLVVSGLTLSIFVYVTFLCLFRPSFVQRNLPSLILAGFAASAISVAAHLLFPGGLLPFGGGFSGLLYWGSAVGVSTIMLLLQVQRSLYSVASLPSAVKFDAKPHALRLHLRLLNLFLDLLRLYLQLKREPEQDRRQTGTRTETETRRSVLGRLSSITQGRPDPSRSASGMTSGFNSPVTTVFANPASPTTDRSAFEY